MSTVSYPKSWVPGEILTAADLNAQFNAVNTITALSTGQIANLAIDSSKLAANAVIAGKIADGAVTTTAKLVDGITSIVLQAALNGAPATPIGGGAGTQLFSVVKTTTRKTVRFHAVVHGHAISISPGGTCTLTLTLLIDAGIVYTAPDISLRTESGDASIRFPICLVGEYVTDALSLASHTFSINVSQAGGNVTSTLTATGLVQEFA